MEGIKNYKEYEELFEDELVVAVRNLLKKIEEEVARNLEDSREHNALIRYFNKFSLYGKMDEEKFSTR